MHPSSRRNSREFVQQPQPGPNVIYTGGNGGSSSTPALTPRSSNATRTFLLDCVGAPKDMVSAVFDSGPCLNRDLIRQLLVKTAAYVMEIDQPLPPRVDLEFEGLAHQLYYLDIVKKALAMVGPDAGNNFTLYHMTCQKTAR
jgi:hypothetical protein